jgi:N-acetylglutamate synthase-like GNAT family acetyltransferase
MLNMRTIEVFRPYANEVPEDLLWSEGISEAAVTRWLAAEMIRVAKRGDEILAMYAMDSGDGKTYVLHGVIVAPGVRKQGLGRWMVGHAIGVAESKGARHVQVPVKKALRFFRAIGFEDSTAGLKYDLVPE